MVLPETKDWITYLITLAALVISGFAWYSAHRNTKAAEASAKAANESLELQKRLLEVEQDKRQARWNAYRKEYKARLIKVAYEIKDAVLGKYQVIIHERDVIDWESLRQIPKQVIFSDDILIEYFSEEERNQVWLAWSRLTYLFKQYGENDIERLGIGYAGEVIQQFSSLISMLEKR